MTNRIPGFRPWRGAALLAAIGMGAAPLAGAYPLDGDKETGILRLRGYRELEASLRQRGLLVPGSFRGSESVGPRLLDQPDLALPEPDPELSKRLAALLAPHADRYGVAVLDLTDPGSIRYFAHQADREQNPGSVGKIVVALAWFQALADLHPGDVGARATLLRETDVVAGAVARGDSHEVPFWQPGQAAIAKRILREGDRGNLYTYLDWMLSSSSNAAASVLLEELVLLRRFGADYPVSRDAAQAWLDGTPKKELQEILTKALRRPVEQSGLDPRFLRQGGLFTQEGKRRIPGGDSTATATELMRFLLRLEQGRLVDPWSSREQKRLLYLTDRRIRYASHPALATAAVYFKSGSLYSCRAEEGFVCKKYHGNVRNFMNSVAIVETDEPGRALHYLVVVLSNVLRENSAVAHQTLALRIHRLIESLHPVPPEPAAEPARPPGPQSGFTPDGNGVFARYLAQPAHE